MDSMERIERMTEEECRERYGMSKERFSRLTKQMEALYRMEHRKGGRPMTFCICDRFAAMLEYYRSFCRIEDLAQIYGVSSSTLCKGIHWAEDAFLQICEPERKGRKNPSLQLQRYIRSDYRK